MLSCVRAGPALKCAPDDLPLSSYAAEIRAASTVGGAIAGVPWWVVLLPFLSYLTSVLWRVYQDPKLMREWLELFDQRRDRR